MLICAVSCLYCTILQLVFAVFYLRIASQPPTLALHLLQLIVALTTVLHLLLFYTVTVLYTVLLCVLQLPLLYHCKPDKFSDPQLVGEISHKFLAEI